jgi:hypothetical protein
MTIALANRTMPNTTGWQDRHDNAMAFPRPGFEAAIVGMLKGWHNYAVSAKLAHGSPIGDDGVLGPEWQAIGQALLGLLNGDIGRLDGGTLDGFIRNTLRDNGAEVE